MQLLDMLVFDERCIKTVLLLLNRVSSSFFSSSSLSLWWTTDIELVQLNL